MAILTQHLNLLEYILRNDCFVSIIENRVIFYRIVTLFLVPNGISKGLEVDDGLICFQFFTQLLAIRRLYLILIGNKLCTQEVLINLCIQIFTVSNDKKCKITRTFMLDLTSKHNHRIALAATLSMPEHT